MASDSPCISVCVMAPANGLCRGCGRTIEEISAWVAMTTPERRAVMATLIQRLTDANMDVDEALRQRLAYLE
jgi:predicted Fe-S protein YdhL (DUF1289 family)